MGATLDLHNYRTEIGPFRVFMMTPQVMAWRQTQAQKALADRKRNDPKKAASWTMVDPIEGWRDWSDYLGERRAVVIFNVTSDKTAFPFYEADKIQGIDEGNFKDMKIYRDGVEIVPVEKVRIPAMLNADQTKAAGKTVAMQGIYVYRVEDFAPRAVGTTANYTMIDHGCGEGGAAVQGAVVGWECGADVEGLYGVSVWGAAVGSGRDATGLEMVIW